MAFSVMAIWVSERNNPNLRTGLSALRWVLLALVARPPWKVTPPIGRIVE